MKRVCITTLEFPPDVGGVGESVYRIAQMLGASGYEVHVAVFRAIFRNERELAAAGQYRRASCQTSERDGIMVHRIQAAVRSTVAKEQDYLSDIYDQLSILHHRYQFDLFHAFFINEMGYLTTLLAQENHLPVINSVRGADLHKHIFSPSQHGQITWTLENSAWTTFVSRDLMRRARVLAPSITSRSSAFWNSITPIQFDHLSKPALSERLQGIVIGSVGSFRDKKGVEYLLDACRSLGDLEFTLLFVGDFVGKESDYWQQEIQDSGLADRIVVTGKISRAEALAYLPQMDIFTIPSIHDGCPNALLEAMLAARAIVGTSVDAIGEILADRQNALVVNPFSSDELATALRHLIMQPDLRQQLGIAARDKVLTQLAPAIEQQNWEQVYQQALGVTRQFQRHV
ncbi:MAG: glycosyltransferase [Pegethrix bostrychoides GSE-TBD4-15B]|jgi:glycosyltransferase involved in cell wall biosynthesis|uniref:Glycosyltransferase n=1 Tax=Pegethrix bostrychoides GSE-TBD4-15B TaxID=2839662 RepID=A0A951P933_9CYAN|nr:glycosyltransferase [Pegethrix bostrychoides GSE-TBD4-15B]